MKVFITFELQKIAYYLKIHNKYVFSFVINLCLGKKQFDIKVKQM